MAITKKINLNTNGINIEFNDLGAEMNEEFKQLFDSFFLIRSTHLTKSFFKKSADFFNTISNNRKIDLSDKYFENFTLITENLIINNQYTLSSIFWNEIIKFVKEWEKTTGEILHKGTPYYFAAEAAMKGYDIDAGLILMHLALQEDIKNYSYYEGTPAHSFVTLNDIDKAQHFKYFVYGMIGFLRDRLDGRGNENGKYKGHYQATRSGMLNYIDLRKKFLDSRTINDELKYFFVYSLIKFWRLRVLQKNSIGDNLMAPLIFTQAIGGLLIIIENLLKTKYSGNTFAPLFTDLSKKEKWQLPNLSKINKERETDFSAWLNKCLNGNSLYYDFELAYGLRNFAFHTIESQKKLWENYTRILQSVLNSFFKTLEIIN